MSCPMCNKSIKLELINAHIDQGCPDPDSSRSKKEEWSKIMGPKSLSRNNEGKGKGKEKEKERFVLYQPFLRTREY